MPKDDPDYEYFTLEELLDLRAGLDRINDPKGELAVAKTNLSTLISTIIIDITKD